MNFILKTVIFVSLLLIQGASLPFLRAEPPAKSLSLMGQSSDEADRLLGPLAGRLEIGDEETRIYDSAIVILRSGMVSSVRIRNLRQESEAALIEETQQLKNALLRAEEDARRKAVEMNEWQASALEGQRTLEAKVQSLERKLDEQRALFIQRTAFLTTAFSSIPCDHASEGKSTHAKRCP
jgi:hypothetical protein